MARTKKESISRKTTSVSLEEVVLDDCQKYAEQEGLSFASMIAALIEEDKEKSERINKEKNPAHIIARYKLKKKRLEKWGNPKLKHSQIAMIDEFIKHWQK